MTHILLECNSIERHLIWSMAESLWLPGPQPWPEINLRMILGIGSVELLGIRPRNNSPGTTSIKIKGRTRLIQILISKASHLIWVLQCERTIHDETQTAPN